MEITPEQREDIKKVVDIIVDAFNKVINAMNDIMKAIKEAIHIFWVNLRPFLDKLNHWNTK